MKRVVLITITGIVLAAIGMLVGCTKTYTPINREETARPRVDQIAFSAALESAYKKVDMSFCTGKKVFVETRALSKQDIEYINSYVRKLIIAKGGYVAAEEKDADIKMSNFLEVTGTDEVTRTFGKDLVVAQVRGNFSITYMSTGITTKIVDLKGTAQTKRNKKANTKVIE